MLNAPAAPHALAVNEMGAIWDKYHGNDGLTETDRMVLICEDRAADRAEISRLNKTLALKNEAIALLRDALAESEAELDTLRGLLEPAEA